ncbi:MAG: beta-ketoacyl-[acyl-carrier-protein] synthase family protein [Bacteroidales bacterium]|nr:beta-ketoacyl-[acyl-carrier-protein] synthase family protein [Bacteroidales bacterium]
MNKVGVKRVVITGMGIISPIGNGIQSFLQSIKEGKSGIRFIPELKELGFSSCIGGVPNIDTELNNDIFSKYELTEADISIKYAVLAGIEAWKDAGLKIPDKYSTYTNNNYGSVVGTCSGGAEIFTRKLVPAVNNNSIKRLGSQIIENTMHSGSAAALSNILALSNQTISNSSACATGTESIIIAVEKIRNGTADLFIAGGTDPYTPFAWAGFDSMRLLSRKFNDHPTISSRPMSQSSDGFVASAGAGMVVVEELEHALLRNATIYAEIIGIATNAGGQRNGGSMTASNPDKVVECIKNAIKDANIDNSKIDLISGHLTGTKLDFNEISNWLNALESPKSLPYINSLKSMTGHMIGAAGSAETIAAVLQLYYQFIHPTINCEDLNPEIAKNWDSKKIPIKLINSVNLQHIAKASFGFGDVNACIILKKFENK